MALSHSRLVFLQVAQMLAIFLGSGATTCPIFDDGTNPDICPAFQPLSDCSSPLDVLALSAPSGHRYFVWQPGTLQDGAGLLKRLLQPPTLGSGTGMALSHSRLVFLQVGYSYRLVNGKPFKKLVPDPNSLSTTIVQNVFLLGAKFLSCMRVARMLLLLSGDVEQNPGPLTSQQEKEMLDVIMTLPSMQQQQTEILSEIRFIRADQQALEQKLSQLAEKVKLVEDNVSPLRDDVTQLLAQNEDLADTCAKLRDSYEDLDGRSRRNNLVVYGLPDTVNETWAQSEAQVIAFCSEKLNVAISTAAIERAHRLGRYTAVKARPIILRFLSFKDKERVLAVASKLKGTEFALSEDYSSKVRQDRKKLIQFAKDRKAEYKLHFNKMKIGNQTFVYNAETDTVTRDTR
ncbi:uncharacterized protein LOC142767862 [Rhipicephalus microplus]|uniref:uncharacterized protein LOC142767862 n=1 Tax=Rhipicephalus microplus TaxID=6941 RepID=UPI003F6D0F79